MSCLLYFRPKILGLFVCVRGGGQVSQYNVTKPGSATEDLHYLSIVLSCGLIACMKSYRVITTFLFHTGNYTSDSCRPGIMYIDIPEIGPSKSSRSSSIVVQHL